MDVGLRFLACCALTLVATQVFAGDIYICKGGHGEKVYQNSPCPTSDDQVGRQTYDSAMARAADGSAGATERIYQPTAPPARNSYGADVADAPSSAANGFDYGAGTHPATSTQRPVTGGIGSSAYQRGEVRGKRCVTAKGRVYYAAGECGTSVTYAGEAVANWHNDSVQGVPGAVMVGPNQATNPVTGQIVQLEAASMTEPVYLRTQDAGRVIDPDDACAGARRAAAGRFNRKADQAVQDLCRSGRSLYDQTYSGGIP